MSDQVHSLVGAYVLNAVTTHERGLFEEHLPDCADCSQEAREFAATAALLGVAAAAAVPPQLRGRVIAQVGRTRQARPLLRFPGGRGFGASRRAVLAGAACLAVVSLGLGGYATHVHADLTDMQRRDQQVAALLTAPDARTVTANAGAATGTVTVSRQRGRMMFLERGLAALPAGRTYQIWLTGQNGPVSAGTFRPDNRTPQPVLMADSADTPRLLVTDEPASGSARPTTIPVLQLDLTPA